MNERKIAARVLDDIETNGAYINIALEKALSDGELKPYEKGFVSELVHGVTERRITIDYVISEFSSVKLYKIAPKVLTALRIGVYQLMFMDKVPPSAAVNESVKLAKKYGGQRVGGYANGVLRNIERNKNNIPYPTDDLRRLSVYYSYPVEIVNMFLDEFGVEFTESMLFANCEKRPLTLRCNQLKISAENLVDSLNNEGVDAKVYQNSRFPNLNCGIEVDKIKNIKTLQSFKNGEFYVQDIAAMLVAEVLNPKENSVVIDMCAAPGGKTTHIAEKMHNKGKVLAFDIYEHKLNLINDNANRLGISICETHLQDATKLNEKYIDFADYVLVDAPCSGFGIIGKKPDIKYQRKPEDVVALADISLSILKNAGKYVKQGGTLVFSTCTIMKAENEEVIMKFLQEANEGFYLEAIDEVAIENQGFITLYPHVDKVDGFFICKMKKR